MQIADVKQTKAITKNKYDINATSIQETQLISLDKYNKETLEGKVNLEKVREIRRALRRRYATRKNIQKLFRAWDAEKKGVISIKSAHDMVNRLGIQCNMNEALVLIASANQNKTSELTLDEFLDLIYNVNDALNVNLQKLPDLAKSEKGNEAEVVQYLQKDANLAREIKRKNQLKLLLQNKAQSLANQCKRADPTNTGQVSSKIMESWLSALNIGADIFQEQDKQEIIQQFSNDHKDTFNYGDFIKNLKEFKFNYDDIYVYYIQPEFFCRNKIQAKKKQAISHFPRRILNVNQSYMNSQNNHILTGKLQQTSQQISSKKSISIKYRQ